MCIDLLNRLLSHGDFTNNSTVELAKFLWDSSKVAQSSKLQVSLFFLESFFNFNYSYFKLHKL